LKNQLTQQESDSILLKEKMIQEYEVTFKTQEERFIELREKYEKEKIDLEQFHQQTIEELEKKLTQEGQELSDRNVR
jgi:lipoate-protein ligase A